MKPSERAGDGAMTGDDWSRRRRERFRALQREFVRDALAEVRELARFVEEAPASGPAAGPRAVKLAHDLRGAGGVYDFKDVSVAAGEVEDALRAGAGGEGLAPALAQLERAVRDAAAKLGSDREVGGVP